MDPSIQNAIRQEVKSAMGESQMGMLDHLDSLITSKLEAAEQNHRQFSAAQMGKLQQDILCNDTFKFNRKSCEDQYKFNVKVSTKLKDASGNLDQGRLDQAKQHISEGIDLNV